MLIACKNTRSYLCAVNILPMVRFCASCPLDIASPATAMNVSRPSSVSCSILMLITLLVSASCLNWYVQNVKFLNSLELTVNV